MPVPGEYRAFVEYQAFVAKGLKITAANLARELLKKFGEKALGRFATVQHHICRVWKQNVPVKHPNRFPGPLKKKPKTTCPFHVHKTTKSAMDENESSDQEIKVVYESPSKKRSEQENDLAASPSPSSSKSNSSASENKEFQFFETIIRFEEYKKKRENGEIMDQSIGTNISSDTSSRGCQTSLDQQ